MTRIVIGDVTINSSNSIQKILEELELEYKLISLEQDDNGYHLTVEDEYGSFNIYINQEES